MRHRQGCVGDPPHPNDEDFEAPTNSDSESNTHADQSATARDDAGENPPPWAGGDGFSLAPVTPLNACWTLLVTAGNESPLADATAEIATVAEQSQDDRALAQPIESASPSFDLSTPDGRAKARPHDRDRHANRRAFERELRGQSVAFLEGARADGWSTVETADVLGIGASTLSYWYQRWHTDGLAAHLRGRPPLIATTERQAEVTGFLNAHGPSISLATLRAKHPDIAWAQLAALRAAHRAQWQIEHGREQCRLEWLCPGSVWAMDFTHPPHLIDGVFPAILNVIDLASHQQLLWLAVEHENATTVVDALEALFAEHGAPLVMKCDNGPAFRAQLTKRFLLDREIFTLYSPPYCARYNGACERANRSLKELTAHVADQEGRPGFWTSDDLLLARLRANRLSRPWGADGATPEESWAARGALLLDKRKNMWQQLKSGIAAVGAHRSIDPTAVFSHYTQSEIERLAAQPVLEHLGLLHITRRRIAPVF